MAALEVVPTGEIVHQDGKCYVVKKIERMPSYNYIQKKLEPPQCPEHSKS